MNSIAKKLHGIIPPVITPFLEDGSIDKESTHKVMDHLVNGGVHALFILGTTGEGPLIPIDQQREFVKIVTEHVTDVPVIVGVSDVSTLKVLNNIDAFSEYDVDVFVSTLPLYYQTKEAEQLKHFKTLADHSPVPLVLYDIPQRVGTKIRASVVLEMAKHDNVAGLKDSSGKLRNFRTLVEELGDDREFTFLLGDSAMIDISSYLGADGVVPTDAHLFPELCVKTYELAREGKWEEARECQRKVNNERGKIQALFPEVIDSNCKVCKNYLYQEGLISSNTTFFL